MMAPKAEIPLYRLGRPASSRRRRAPKKRNGTGTCSTGKLVFPLVFLTGMGFGALLGIELAQGGTDLHQGGPCVCEVCAAVCDERGVWGMGGR